MNKKILAFVTLDGHRVQVSCMKHDSGGLIWLPENAPETIKTAVWSFGPLPKPASLTEARNILRAAFFAPEYCLELVYGKAGRPRGCKPSRTVTLRFTGNQLQALQARGLDSHPAIRAWILDLVKKAL